MNAKHTPGPWRNNKWNCQEHQISALGGTIALVSHGHSLVSEESADANARLIAAAPELLEACKAVMRLDYLQEHNALAQQVKSAIAKAEGE